MANAAVIAAIGASQQAAAWRAAISNANAGWGSYAAARGFYFGVGRAGWGHDRLPRLEGSVDGIRVALELVGTLYTAVLATPLAPLHGHVGITRSGTVSRLGALFGAQDISLGDPPFDARYDVKATDEALAHRLAGPLTRSEMMALDAYTFSYDDGAHDEHHPVVAMYIRTLPTGAEEIDRVFRVVVASAKARPEPNSPYR